ncbi:hypothetical protein RFI_37482 [Reticulomyxa filosa]|uniref:Uncharacterized protein n=1 Tax=Reticulomyxa filosa TaxID=46433 RepID=X6LGY1_RETFI|nr:hypothetical protein RFI_37482 [Reticulomyxa filosa]|eukprot:ETN99974.1 hypothetical protein RFI_37482 [Reticulomyxa filosa]
MCVLFYKCWCPRLTTATKANNSVCFTIFTTIIAKKEEQCRQKPDQSFGTLSKGTNPPKPQIPQLIHSDVQEPFLEVDVLVPEPELNSNIIRSSPLAFMNVLDALREICNNNMSTATQYMEQMKEKAKKLSEMKSLLQKVEKHGWNGLETEFESSGDVNADLGNLQNEVLRLQTDLFQLDEECRPIHTKMRQINSIENDLEKYQDNYFSTMAQLRRVHGRIQQVLQDHQTQRDSAMTALEATELQQAVMKCKINDKIAESLIKIDRLQQQLQEAKEQRIASQSYATSLSGLYTSYFATAQDEKKFDQDHKSPKELELEEEVNMCNNFLTGLNEFLKGLKKLRKEQRNRITHLEEVTNQLHNQRASIAEKIGNFEQEAIQKLHKLHCEFISPSQQSLQNNLQYQSILQFGFILFYFILFEINQYYFFFFLVDNREKEEEEIKTNRPALSLENVLRKRVNRMNQVYKKLRDLENRAMTTGSREYLRGLTEIRELQVIMSNQYLKFFFTDFVTKANQIFHDLQLASIAILEQTAGPDDNVILELAGVKTLIRVLERNKREIHLAQDIEETMRFMEAMPDREIVIMHVARHLALSMPYKHFITGKYRPASMMPSLPANDNRDITNPYVVLELFVTKLLEEWIGSVCNTFGKTTTTNVKAALEDDVIAQVRPSNAARLVVNCVWGLDGSL